MSENQTQSVQIRVAASGDVEKLWDMIQFLGARKEKEYFERQMEYQVNGERDILIASVDGEDVGYCVVNRAPKYAYFKVENIPEIQDLNVLQKYRRRGIATALIAYCETEAVRRGHKKMGISVGLDAGYGPAQKLYIKLGYVPDGHGVTYNRIQVGHGEFRPVDDNLCLMMVKALENTG